MLPIQNPCPQSASNLLRQIRCDANPPWRVLRAFVQTPRHHFVTSEFRAVAYENRALPLSQGQTISQPTMLAIMLDELQCDDTHRTLEVGAGSGYAAALLSHLCAEVNTVEIRPILAERARNRLAIHGYSKVHVCWGDGSQGWPEHAPFDRILVSAAVQRVPDALFAQLTIGGRMVVPIHAAAGQVLMTGIRQRDGSMRWRRGVPCSFVPLLTPAHASDACDPGVCRPAG